MEFYDATAAHRAMVLNSTNVLGRAMRVDYSSEKRPRVEDHNNDGTQDNGPGSGSGSGVGGGGGNTTTGGGGGYRGGGRGGRGGPRGGRGGGGRGRGRY